MLEMFFSEVPVIVSHLPGPVGAMGARVRLLPRVHHVVGPKLGLVTKLRPAHGAVGHIVDGYWPKVGQLVKRNNGAS